MHLLAIESSSETLSVALLADGQVLSREASEPRRHGSLILGLVDQLLAEAGIARRQLDAIAFGRGPGAFTGVRLACSVAQGLGFGLDRPVYPVSTLAALARAGFRAGAAGPALVLLDARMGELYAGGFQWADGTPQIVLEEQLTAPKDLDLPGDDDWSVWGSGWSVHRAQLGPRLGIRLHGVAQAPQLAHARDVAALALLQWRSGARPGALEALPVYLRDKVALTRAEREAAQAAA